MNPEEAKCAIVIDSAAKGRYWVRNVERSEYSLWLPTIEKDIVGRLWETKSDGTCIFRMVTKEEIDANFRAVLS